LVVCPDGRDIHSYIMEGWDSRAGEPYPRLGAGEGAGRFAAWFAAGRGCALRTNALPVLTWTLAFCIAA
jgi:hypothetical protein